MRKKIQAPPRYQDTYFKYGNAVVDVFYDEPSQSWSYAIRTDAKLVQRGFADHEAAFAAAEAALEDRHG